MNLKPVLKKINFKFILFYPIFSPSIVYLFTTILLTSHQLILSLLTLLTIHRHDPPLSAATIHRRRPPSSTANCHHGPPLTVASHCRLPSSTTTNCHHLSLSVTIRCCHHPVDHHLPSLATTIFHCSSLPTATICHCLPLPVTTAC